MEGKRKISNNNRLKEQKLVQDEYKISRNECEEFIRIVKKHSNHFDMNDLIKYCKLNKIPLNESTISCMFEELIINKYIKSDKINADVLISLISRKKRRCFYVPVVVFIGKCNYLKNYEKELIKEKDLNEKEKKIEKDKLKRQHEKDEKNKKENEMKRHISEDTIFDFYKKRGQLSENHNEELMLQNKDDNNNSNISSTEIKDNIVNSENNKEKIGKENNLDEEVNVELYEKNKKNNKKALIHANNKCKENSKKLDESKIKKCSLNKRNKCIPEKDNKKYEKKENESLNEFNDYKKEEKRKYYYDSLLQRVLNNKQTRYEKKEEYLKSFHLVSYFRLDELISISYLIEKYYNYYYKEELYDLIDIYDEINKRKKKNKDYTTGCENNLLGQKNLLKCKENELECTKNIKDINPSEIINKYEEERKNKKRNIYNNNTYKYINSNLLNNYRFIEKNLNNIMNYILSNLNFFFNQNINDIEELKKEYDTVIKNICDFNNSNFKYESTKEDNFDEDDYDKSCDKDMNKSNINEKIEVLNENKVYKKMEKKSDTNQVNEKMEINFNENMKSEKTEKKIEKNNEKKINKNNNIKRKEGNFNILNEKEKEKADLKEGSVIYKENKLFRAILKKKKKALNNRFKKYNSITSFSITTDGECEEREFESDYSINYLNLKYDKEELEKLKNKNFIYYLTNDINEIKIFKKTYFYDFFFIYLFRKLFWNILALYSLYLDKYKKDNSDFHDKKEEKNYDNLIIYESDVSLNNSKKNKNFLYNTKEMLCSNLTDLFELIKKEKLLIYLRYDENKKIKIKNRTEYIYRDLWIYLILTSLKKNHLKNFNFNEFILFQELKTDVYSS